MEIRSWGAVGGFREVIDGEIAAEGEVLHDVAALQVGVGSIEGFEQGVGDVTAKEEQTGFLGHNSCLQ